MSLTPEDHVEINALYPRAAISFDTGDAEAFAGCFTREGVFGGSADPVVGHDALVAYVRRRFADAPGMSHHISNVLIEESADGSVRGRAYGVILGIGEAGALVLRTAGSYEDAIVREDGSWRFASRAFTPRVTKGHVGAILAGPPA